MVLFSTLSPHVSSSFLEGSVHNNGGEALKHSASSSFSLHSSNVDVDDNDDAQQSLRFEAASFEEKEQLPTTKQQSHDRCCSFVVIFTMIFFNGCCFTAVAPSVPFYLQILKAPPEFLGWVVSFYSLGQIIGSPLGGWLLSKGLSSKTLLTLSSILGLLSSCLYAVAPVYMFILVSRILTGISAGMEFTTELAFIANHTTFQERTAYLASVTACNVLGFIMGPALGIVLAMLDIRIGGVIVDQYTGPGWLLTAMFFIDVIMVRGLFRDIDVEVYETTSPNNSATNEEPSEKTELLKKKEKPEASSSSYGGVVCENKANPQESSHTSVHDDYDNDDDHTSISLVLSLIFVQFSLMCGFSLLETITSPLVQDEFGWSVTESNLLFTCGGIFSLGVYVIFVIVSKHVPDRWLVLTALILCSMGFLLAINWQELHLFPTFVSNKSNASIFPPPYLACFLVGFALVYGGFMTGRSVTFALYSKLVSQQRQGEFLSWMVAGGSAARTLGPFAAVALYYGVSGKYNLLAIFGPVGLFHLACLALVVCQWPQLLPGNPELQSLPTHYKH